MISKKEYDEFVEKHEKMNMAKFLARYCNLIGNDLTKITHEDVRVLFPILKRASFDFVCKNPRIVAIGEVVLVDDGKFTIPYFTPKINLDELDEPTKLCLNKAQKRIANQNIKDYTKMSIYELRCLLRTKFNSCKTRKKARCELEKRGVVLSKKYKREEEKREVEKNKNERY